MCEENWTLRGRIDEHPDDCVAHPDDPYVYLDFEPDELRFESRGERYWRYAPLRGWQYNAISSLCDYGLQLLWGIFWVDARLNVRTRELEIYVGGTW